MKGFGKGFSGWKETGKWNFEAVLSRVFHGRTVSRYAQVRLDWGVKGRWKRFLEFIPLFFLQVLPILIRSTCKKNGSYRENNKSSNFMLYFFWIKLCRIFIVKTLFDIPNLSNNLKQNTNIRMHGKRMLEETKEIGETRIELAPIVVDVYREWNFNFPTNVK